MSAASLSDPQSLNLYSYCGNDPINHVDPDGLFFKKLFGWIGKTFKWIAIAAVIAIAVLTVVPGAWAGTVLAKIGIWAGKHQILASLLGIHSPQWVIVNIASTAGATAAGFWAMAGVGAVNGLLQQRRPGRPRPPSKKTSDTTPGRIPAEDNTGRQLTWFDIWADNIKAWLESDSPSAERLRNALAEGRNCGGPQDHHAIPYGNEKWGHQNHRLVQEAGVNLSVDPRNVRLLLNHRGRHLDSYHREVNRRLEETYNSMSAFSTRAQYDAALGGVMGGIWRDIDNGSLRPYNRDVYGPLPCK